MGEENTPPPVAPQAGDGGTNPEPQAGTTTPGEPQAGDPQSQQPKPAKSAGDYERMINELRKENAGHRTRLKTFEDEEKKRQEAQLSEQQKLEKRFADLQKSHEDYRTSVQDRIVTTELRAQAADLGFADLSDAVRLLDRSELEFDDDGIPTNAHQLLEKLAKAKPYLLKSQAGASRPANTSGGATNPSRSTTAQPTEITQDYVNRVMANKAEWDGLSQDQRTNVLNWLAKNPFRF